MANIKLTNGQFQDLLNSIIDDIKRIHGDNCRYSIEFNGDGEWRDVDAQRSAVPAAIVPNEIKNYVDKNYAGDHIVELKRGRYGWEVKLSRGLELEFDSAFRLTEVDD